MTWVDRIITTVFGFIVTVTGLISMFAWGYNWIPWPLAVFAIVCCVIALVGIGYYIASIKRS